MPEATSRRSSWGRVLIAVYAVFAVAATGRSVYQLATQASEAPFPYALSALAAVVYIAATLGLAREGEGWRRSLGRRARPSWSASSWLGR